MMPAVTVLLPTHDHQDTLYASIESVQRQTLTDFELIVIGDGATPRSREIVESIGAADPRVSYRQFPKSPRTGEQYRDELIRESTAPHICYQSDDDLWLPHHLEVMVASLRTADFVHSLHINVETDDTTVALLGSLKSPDVREALVRRRGNYVGLPFASHTRSAYLKLSRGWESTPVGCFTDLYMWSKWMELPADRLASALVPTALHFPSPLRGADSADNRLQELRFWSKKIDRGDCLQWLWSKLHYSPGFLIAALRGEWPNSLPDLLDHHKLRIRIVEPDCFPSPPVQESASPVTIVWMTALQYDMLETTVLDILGQLQPGEAQKRWEAALHARPFDGEARVRVAGCLVRQSLWQQLEEFLAPCVQDVSNARADIVLSYAQSLSAQQRFVEAEACLAARLERSPRDGPLLEALARLLMRLGRAEEGISRLELAISDDKTKYDLLRRLALLLIESQRFSEAKNALVTSLNLNPDEPSGYSLLATVNAHLKDWEAAVYAFEQASIRRARQPPAFYALKHEVLSALERSEEARAAAREGLGWYPNHPVLKQRS